MKRSRIPHRCKLLKNQFIMQKTDDKNEAG